MIKTNPSEQVLQCLQFLAGRCDFAHDRDGVGFNGIDAHFGHYLASFDALSVAQALQGAKMIRKYRKQLASGGLSLPDEADLQEYVEHAATVAATTSSAPAEEKKQSDQVFVQSGRIVVQFAYDPAKVAAMQPLKAIKKWQFNLFGKKEWSFPVESIDLVLTAIKPFENDFSFAPEIATQVEQQRALAEIARQEQELEQQRLAEEIKAALASVQPYLDGNPLPGGRILFPHQREAVRQMINQRRVILAHDMGLGKSASALVAAKAYDCPVIVICPASLKINWLREAEQVGVAIEVWSWAKMPEPPECNFILVADESHYAQAGAKSIRGQNFLALAEQARAVFCLTGTPLKNGRPINLFPLLQACKHELAQDKKAYEHRYCAAHMKSIGRKEVYDVTGAAHLDELYKKTSGSTILYKKKKDCLDLPEKIRVFREVEVSAQAKKAYQERLEELRKASAERIQAAKDAQDAMIAAALEAGEEIDPADLKDPDQARAIVELGILRHAGSLAKVESAIEIAQEVLEQGESIVIFTAYLDTAEQIREALSCEALICSTTTEQRQQMIDNFQAKQTRAIVCTLGAGGVGITLTAASTVMLVDRPWTPGDAIQSEDRCHRIGQTNNVTAIWLQYEQVDAQVDALLIAKQERIELVLSGQRKTLRGIKSIKELAKDIVKAVKSGKMLKIEDAEDAA